MIIGTVYPKIALAAASSLVASVVAGPAQVGDTGAYAHLYAYLAAVLGIIAGLFARIAWLRETKRTKKEIAKDALSSMLAIFAYFIITMMIVETVGVTSKYAIACIGMGLVLCGVEFTVSAARKYINNLQPTEPPSSKRDDEDQNR